MWFSRRALRLHALIAVVVPTFAALCVWQVHRALGGNELSWAYVFEWPFFAGYAVYMWWRFVHEAAREEPREVTREGTREGTPQAPPPAHTTSGHHDDEEEAERIAYNNYLAQLAAQDKRKQWR
ncbi:MAG: hypothetical protein ACLPVF_08670 [Acidimicrobiales bacterium]